MTNRDVGEASRSRDEEMAAFLEGKLAPEERARVLRRVADDPDAYELLVESAAVLDSLQPAGQLASGGRRRPLRWRWASAGLAAAAAIAAVIGIRSSRGDAGSVDALLRMATAVDAGALPSGSFPSPPWQDVRAGAQVEEPLRLRRAGVRLADLVAATGAANTSGAAVAGRDVARELDGLLGAAPVVAELRSAAGAAEAGNAEWRPAARSAARDVVEVFDSFELRLGLWTETVRLAALTGDRALLGSDDVRGAGRRLAEQEEPPGTSRLILDILDALDGGAPDAQLVLDRVVALLDER